MFKRFWLGFNVLLYWIVMVALYLIIAVPWTAYKLGGYLCTSLITDRR